MRNVPTPICIAAQASEGEMPEMISSVAPSEAGGPLYRVRVVFDYMTIDTNIDGARAYHSEEDAYNRLLTEVRTKLPIAPIEETVSNVRQIVRTAGQLYAAGS